MFLTIENNFSCTCVCFLHLSQSEKFHFSAEKVKNSQRVMPYVRRIKHKWVWRNSGKAYAFHTCELKLYDDCIDDCLRFSKNNVSTKRSGVQNNLKYSSLSHPVVFCATCKAFPRCSARSTRHDKLRETNNALCSNAFYVPFWSRGPWCAARYASLQSTLCLFLKARRSVWRGADYFLQIPFYANKKNAITMSFETN